MSRWLIIICCLLAIGCSKDQHKILIKRAAASTCTITTGSMVGTGVYLKSGYVLTAAHVVDWDRDDIISEKEKITNLNFFGSDLTYPGLVSIKGEVISSDLSLDIAVIKPLEQVPAKGVLLASNKTCQGLKLGTSIYTIGAPIGRPLHFTSGHISYPSRDNTLGAASLTILPGNSGGGVFLTSSGRCIGVVVRGLINQQSITFPMFRPDGMMRIMRVRFSIPIPSMAKYVQARQIRYFLATQNLALASEGRSNQSEKWQEALWYAILIYMATILIILGWVGLNTSRLFRNGIE